MAQTSRDFGEFLRRSLCAAAASVTVGEDGLDRIQLRLARARSSTAPGDCEIAARGARSARARQPKTARRQQGRASSTCNVASAARSS
jgi:hypothetical protein